MSHAFFGWSGIDTGFYLALLNVLVIPVHLAVACLSTKISDRIFIIGSLVVSAIASFCCIQYGFELSEPQYIIANFLMFFGTNVTDGTSNGLLSKLMPLHLQASLFNAGFSAVLMGTLGKVFGNAAVSLASYNGI